MKTIKIIDLLNKKANDEEMPKKIKFENFIYIWRDIQKDYFCEQINHSLESIIGEYLFENLNLEVGIIEEDKEIEKIDVIDYDKCINYVTHKEKEILLQIRKTQIKFNELIDKVNSLEKKQ